MDSFLFDEFFAFWIAGLMIFYSFRSLSRLVSEIFNSNNSTFGWKNKF